MPVAVSHRLSPIAGTLAAIAAVALVAAAHGAAATAPALCSEASLSVVVPATQGASMQSVALLAVANSGVACRLVAKASLSVVHNGVRVASIHGNPVSYRIDQTIGHGTTALLHAWWGNWCGSRRGSFRVRAAIGALTASGPYGVLPVCNSASAPSRLSGVRYRSKG